MRGELPVMEYESIEQAETARIKLAAGVEDIEAQLSDKCKYGSDGNRLPKYDYHTWRNKALGARSILLRKLRATNAWLKQARAIANPARPPGYPRELMGRAVAMVRGLIVGNPRVPEGVELSETESVLLDEMDDYARGVFRDRSTTRGQ